MPKMTMVLAGMLMAGCLDNVADPANQPPAEDRSVLDACGRPPQIPQWDAVSKAGDPGVVIVTVSAKTLDARMAWETAIESWSHCADHSQ
jgi:hypothetical protein